AFGLGLGALLGPLAGCNRSSHQSSMARLQLSEVMAQNDSFLVTDTRGDQIVQDWVEVHNPNSFPVNLTGYTLSDRMDKPKKFRFPAGMMIPPNGYLLVFLADEEKCDTKCESKHAECEQSAGSSASEQEACDEDLASCLANCAPAGLVA